MARLASQLPRNFQQLCHFRSFPVVGSDALAGWRFFILMTNEDKSGVGVSWVVDREGCALVLLELWVRIWDDASPVYQYRIIVRIVYCSWWVGREARSGCHRECGVRARRNWVSGPGVGRPVVAVGVATGENGDVFGSRDTPAGVTAPLVSISTI